MSRKIKHNAIFNQKENAIEDNSTEQLSISQPIEIDKSNTEQNKVESEQYDNLVNEKENLQEQLAKYIEENKNLKEQLNIANEKIEKCDTDKLDQLQQENDEQLMKISDLTFDNEKLQVEIQEFKNRINQLEQQIATQQPPKHPANGMYKKVDNRFSNNGYTSWN